MGEDVFEPISDAEAERTDFGRYIKYCLPQRNPEEEVEHVYDGDNPKDPECWGRVY